MNIWKKHSGLSHMICNELGRALADRGYRYLYILPPWSDTKRSEILPCDDDIIDRIYQNVMLVRDVKDNSILRMHITTPNDFTPPITRSKLKN